MRAPNSLEYGRNRQKINALEADISKLSDQDFQRKRRIKDKLAKPRIKKKFR